jgi:hypothetical protein
VFMNGVYPKLFSKDEAETVRRRYEEEVGQDGGDGISLVRRAALRAALSEYHRARSQREQLRRLNKGAGQDAVELPFLFVRDFDMSAIEAIADTMEKAV